ncbi:LutC/YkgG family protein [Buchananella hordeovulneris]|uniref:Lactate utilization protein B/C n=1 Tax=Buchananella hordeovulneris TaxID=52770 RepID=A0A1Q5PU75_9ACTO|nr:LUD domain-containing protein [Buchananella hordeovulneris]MDO5081272.1 LUD domain-containing protein [Buchananella hordeovulneris]OKL51114.1 lactate utilization protein B/C [Buchananella hordeovulneris]RRD43346.1 lactate utilization protein C [Buchananella hordeovulneris]RRD50044.1 lactate utilization protein C [Buchananella hordeovulneris]
MDAKTAILARVRDALAKSQRAPAPPVPRDYRQVGEHAPGSAPVVEAMVESLEDYGADVRVVADRQAVADAIDALLGQARSVVIPAGLPAAYQQAAARGDREVRVDTREQPLSKDELDATDAVLTCCRLGISLSGTIVLDGQEDQGRRAITLVPDKHVIVLERETIQPTVPQAVAILGEHPTRPLTWIAGPSATSDIELVRINGVHGPRQLGVAIVG